ncbi:hypothetical protein ACFYT3_27105 [Nocardia amikacinitolerans]|uniref:hypothetical protein n=1 Tax=Nocardia amikacinitolerans TaxID=756689 RepID=UPI0036B1C8FD
MRERVTHGRAARESGMRWFSLLLLVWLAIGMIAAGQRQYFNSGPINCAGFGTIALTAISGPLNYLGLNPKVSNCVLPRPSE